MPAFLTIKRSEGFSFNPRAHALFWNALSISWRATLESDRTDHIEAIISSSTLLLVGDANTSCHPQRSIWSPAGTHRLFISTTRSSPNDWPPRFSLSSPMSSRPWVFLQTLLIRRRFQDHVLLGPWGRRFPICIKRILRDASEFLPVATGIFRSDGFPMLARIIVFQCTGVAAFSQMAMRRKRSRFFA